MTRLIVNNLTNLNQNGPVSFLNGVNVAAGSTIGGDVSITGVCTAVSFTGDGSALTSLPVATISLVVGYKFLFSFDECNSPRT